LGQIAKASPGVGIGSYPWYGSYEDHGVALVARSTNAEALAGVQAQLEALARSLGAEPEIQS
jgi:hypothetical protein